MAIKILIGVAFSVVWIYLVLFRMKVQKKTDVLKLESDEFDLIVMPVKKGESVEFEIKPNEDSRETDLSNYYRDKLGAKANDFENGFFKRMDRYIKIEEIVDVEKTEDK